jgi:hypothetical protein
MTQGSALSLGEQRPLATLKITRNMAASADEIVYFLFYFLLKVLLVFKQSFLI